MAVKVKTTKALSSNVYSVTLEITEFSGLDADLSNKFGEPEVQIGGTFTGASDTITLDSALRKVPTGFPVLEQFTGSDFVDPSDIASVYALDILSRITTAITTLRGNTDSFSGESVSTL